MKIKDLQINERRQQRTEIAYHGTSSKFVSSIMKHGLQINPGKRTYSDSQDPYKTFPGAVYLTRHKHIAVEHAETAVDRFGGDLAIIKIQYTKNSDEIDEDNLYSAISQIFLKQFTPMDELKNPRIFELVVDDAVNRLIKYPMFKQTNNETVLSRIDALIRFLLRKIMNIKYTKQELKLYTMVPFIDNNDQNELKDTIKVSDTLSTTNFWVSKVRQDPQFEKLMLLVMRSLKDSGNNTWRIPRQIGFRGKTRILSIVLSDEEDEYQIYPQDNSQKTHQKEISNGG